MHDGNLEPDMKGAEYSSKPSTKYSDNESENDSDDLDLASGDTLEEKFLNTALLGQEWDAAAVEAGETPLGPDTEEAVLKVAALTQHNKVCKPIQSSMVPFQILSCFILFFPFLQQHHLILAVI